jgi:hypothetical protein
MEPYPPVDRPVRINPATDVETLEVCPSCNEKFWTSNPNQKLCRRGCGRKRSSKSKHGARAAKREAHQVDFIGVDGEGVDRPDGAHDYILLSVGDQSLERGGRRLETLDIFSFLWRCHKRKPYSVYVGFYLGYDFAHWLRDLPQERAEMLLLTEGMAKRRPSGEARRRNPVPFPVRWHGWEFDFLPNLKRFKLRPCQCGECSYCRAHFVKESGWFYVCDVGGMYQTSFVKAIDPADWSEPICSPAEFEQIKEGKANRSQVVEVGAPVDPEMRAYNVEENELLARLMARQNAGLTEMGVKLTKTQWHGPGQAAQAWLKLAAPDHAGRACADAGDLAAFDAARRSYFGGWFEITCHGLVPGVTYEYDINSAYPSVIAELPCLLHGSWTHHDGNHRPRRPYRLVYATVSGSDPFLGAMTHRNPNGGVMRPLSTQGWYWQHEVEAARAAGLVDQVHVAESWSYEPCDCPPPFAAIRELYEVRLRAGKASPLGRAAKLVYNSTYGKMAQSIGDPLFGNPVYASLITAGCRTMILRAIGTHPRRAAGVVMVATDGVYFDSPHPTLDVDPGRLGAWDYGEKRNLSLFKPGVYWDDKARRAVAEGGRLELKSRGVNARALADEIGRIDDQWRRFDQSAVLPDPAADMARWPSESLVAPFTMISPRQALRRGRWELAAHVEHGKLVRQSSAPHRKRQPQPPPALEGSADLIRSRPWPTGEALESVPYDKHFGLDLEQKEDETRLITPEGDYSALVDELLGLNG